MSLLFVESFDHFVTADLYKKWTSPGYGGGVIGGAIVAGEGRCGSQALFFDVLDGATKGVTVTGTPSIGFAGFAYHAVSAFAANPIFSVTNGSAMQWTLSRELSGALSVTNFGGSVQVSSAADAVRTGGWYYIEVGWTQSTAAGAITVKVNGVVVATATSIRTTSIFYPATTWDAITLSNTNNASGYFDDVYVCDDGGASPWNTFLGDVRVEYLRPTANGANTAWTVVGGGTQANAVDKNTASNLTTPSVTSAVTGNRITNGYADPSVPSGPCFGVQVSALAVKDAAGLATLGAVVRHSGSEAVATAQGVSQTTSSYKVTTLQVNPVTAAAWTLAQVAAAEFGQDRVS